ncbi:Ni/Fe hydrogenase subunit alpha [Patescibacteria group bacterium]
MDHISKIEGAATLDVRLKDDKVEYVHMKILEHKRFYTKAIEGKPIVALPQLLSRICGTCSNAHIMASIEACEHALGIEPSPQTMLLRHLTMNGLNIRDHALHLYLFAMPDVVGKDAFLDFDEDDEFEHQMLHDGFGIKAAGNHLAELVAGRSVHAQFPAIGGFMKFPDKEGIEESIKKLQEIREAVLRCIKVFMDCDFKFDRHTNFMGLVPKDQYGFLDGDVVTSKGEVVPEDGFRDLLEHVVIPYSMASGYVHKGEPFMIGSLARINLAQDKLMDSTKKSAADALALFPSTNIFHNNLAQAIEILHCVDQSLDIFANNEFTPEERIAIPKRAGVGVGVVEAPRGTLYHKVEVGEDGIVKSGEVIVPTGMNQINMEYDIGGLIEQMLAKKTSEEEMMFEMEKLIRAYDPCMSCASHFLKVNWKK